MYAILELFALVLALCADAFTASFLYGTEAVRIPPLSAGILAFLSTVLLAAAMFAGYLLRPFFPSWLSSRFPSLACAVLLLILGIIRLRSASVRDIAVRANLEEPGLLSTREAFVLGLALSLDNAAAGLGSGLEGVSRGLFLFLSLFVGLFSIALGGFLGRRAGKYLPMDLSRMSGFVLILLALLKLIRGTA